MKAFFTLVPPALFYIINEYLYFENLSNSEGGLYKPGIQMQNETNISLYKANEEDGEKNQAVPINNLGNCSKGKEEETLKKIMNDMKDLNKAVKDVKYKVELNLKQQNNTEDIKSIKTEYEELKHQFRDLKIYIELISKPKYLETVLQIIMTCAVQFLGVLIVIYFLRKFNAERQSTENGTLENSIAVVSFTSERRDAHLKIAKGVTRNYEFRPFYADGMRSISSEEPNSKVCLVFVDYNERNIILETNVDTSRCRSKFVASQLKNGGKRVIVIYCQKRRPHALNMLYNRNLFNIQEHKILRHLQRQNCVLSIDEEFSDYQKKYLDVFLEEALM